MSPAGHSVALIGCGRISAVHLQTIAQDSRAQLVAVCDVDEAAAQAVADAYGVGAFSDAAHMVDTLHPEAVVLCTPPNTHRAIATMALAAGCHVLCEKPIAITVEDAEAMIAEAERTEGVLMMASKFRYMDDIIKARAMIQSGVFGEIVMFENEFCSHVDMSGRWNADPAISGGGVLIDNGSHSVDIVRYMLGPIEGLQAVRGKKWQDLPVEDTCRLTLRCVDGAMASIDLSWSIHKENPYFINVFGTAGTLAIGWRGSRYRQTDKVDWIDFGSGYDKIAAVSAQLANFLDTIEGENAPLITKEDALASVKAVTAAYCSANNSVWQKIEQ